MSLRSGALRGSASAVGVVLLLTTVACAHVNREEHTTDLAQLRQEIDGEQQVRDATLNERIDGIEARVDDLDRRQAETAERLEWLAEELEKLNTEFGVTVEKLEGAIAFNVPVNFEFDSAALDDNDTAVLDRFAHLYGEYYGDGLITVEGFTDEAGSKAYNDILGRRRAEEVKSYLTEIGGLDDQKVRTVSYGESEDRLVAPGEFGRSAGAANRRVVLVIDQVSSAESAPEIGQ